MKNLKYCVDCRRIANFNGECNYCQSTNIKELRKNSPVNVIGTKIKGRIITINDSVVEVLYIDERKNTSLRQYEADKLRKIL